MKATDLDTTVDCPICNGTGDEPGAAKPWGGTCPRCAGTGLANRYQDGEESEVVIDEEYVDYGTHAVHRMVRMERDTFDSMFGSAAEVVPDEDTARDLSDQLGNRAIGANATDGEYELGDGTVIERSAFPDGEWPSSPDLTLAQAVAWTRARGDESTARALEKIRAEIRL